MTGVALAYVALSVRDRSLAEDVLANDLCEQGGSGQVFADGYEAWQAALPYAGDCVPC